MELRANGLYCAAGEFYIDPWRPVDRAILTHAHADRACPGSRSYLSTREGEALVHAQVGAEAVVETVEYGQRVTIGDAAVSLHPAGHITGSAQVRIEHGGEIWVISGDYKLEPDPTCTPFEPVRCHTFLTDGTFALPIFRWPDAADTMAASHAWWRGNRKAGKNSLLYAHPVGKIQRVSALLDRSIGPVAEAASIDAGAKAGPACLILAPPAFHNTLWSRQFAPASTALVSGWMRIRGTRRRRALDRGFVLSDHADWPGLLRVIDATGAETVGVTHGQRAALVRWLEQHGRRAMAIETRFESEGE